MRCYSVFWGLQHQQFDHKLYSKHFGTSDCHPDSLHHEKNALIKFSAFAWCKTWTINKQQFGIGEKVWTQTAGNLDLSSLLPGTSRGTWPPPGSLALGFLNAFLGCMQLWDARILVTGGCSNKEEKSGTSIQHTWLIYSFPPVSIGHESAWALAVIETGEERVLERTRDYMLLVSAGGRVHPRGPHAGLSKTTSLRLPRK